MTPAERYANALPDVLPGGQIFELPSTAWIIGGLFGVTGAGIGAMLGLPVGAGLGGLVGFGVGYFGYKGVERVAVRGGRDGRVAGEETLIRKYLDLHEAAAGPLSLDDLYRIRRACL